MEQHLEYNVPVLRFQPQEKNSNLKDASIQLTSNMYQFMTNIETSFQNQAAYI